MKIPFYQTEWFNLSLIEIANELNHPLNKLADASIYNRFYKKLLDQREINLSEDYLNSKRFLSNWISDYFNKNELQDASILSLGCGLGLIEQPLIKKGFRIDLQECQDISIQYLYRNYPDESKKFKFILSNDLKGISDSSYDIITAIGLTYCLTNDTLAKFMKSVQRILKPGGLFISYDLALSMCDIKSYLKYLIVSKLKPTQDNLLWGWKRSNKTIISLGRENNLIHKEIYLFNNSYQELNTKSFQGIFFNKSVAAQLLVFKKK